MYSNFDDFNYSEIIIFDQNNFSDKNIIDINWNENKFNNLIKKLISNGFRSFEKKYKITKHNELILIDNISDNKLNLNVLNLVNHEYLQDNKYIENSKYKILLIKYQKETIPPFKFPSTDIIHDKYYLNKIIFKITSRIYLNFEINKKYDSGEVFRRVYINLNNDNKSKNKLDNKDINKILEESIRKYFE